jgi:DHA2 family multidrug resistance protein
VALKIVELNRPKSVNPWVVTMSVMLATFMEILDTTVVNVSIQHIAGNLAATVDEGTWVVTSYLVANAIVLPMSGWLANRFGRRRLILGCVAGFTVASVLCAVATSLEWLILFRILQGLTGGGMQPLAQAIMLESFPKEKHGLAMAAYGVGIILAPILGPMLGGYITDHYSWRWIFYLNAPVGVFSYLMMLKFVWDPPYIKRQAGGADLWGMGFLAVGLGALQVVLDTGQRKDWFASDFIRFYAVLCVVGLVLLVYRELTTEHPIVNLRALADTTFSAGVVLITGIGFILYASLVLLPIYLQTLLGYPAFTAGLALSPRGLGSLCVMPIVGVLTSKIDPRKIIGVGFVLGGFTMFDLSHLSLTAGYWDIFWPQVFQGVALSCLFIPLMAVSVARIPKEKMGNATSIFNLMRNIGGSFGIAVMTTFLTRRNQFHYVRLGENLTAGSVSTRQTLSGLKSWFVVHGSDPFTAGQQALGAMHGMLMRQASMLSFVEAFWMMGVMFVGMLPLLLILRRPDHQVEARVARRVAKEKVELREPMEVAVK